jgi:hypothetical protein
MLQTPEIATARIQAWFRAHPSVAETDANIAILTKYIADHFSMAGECVIDGTFLDLAYRNIGSTLQHIAGPEVQAQIAQINHQALEAQQRLAEEQAERNRQAVALEREQRLEQMQRNRHPGRASAYEGAEEANRQRQREATERQKAAVTAEQHHKFLTELHAANNHIVTMNDGSNRVQWGKTEDARNAMREALKRKYPVFASEVR